MGNHFGYSRHMPQKDETYVATVDQKIGGALKRERENRNLTQEEVAKRMRDFGFDFRQTTIYKIETGRRGVSIGEALALARSVGIPLERLTVPDADSVDAVSARVRGYSKWSIEALEGAVKAVGAVSASVRALQKELDVLRERRREGASSFDTMDLEMNFEPLVEAGYLALAFEHDVEELFMRPAGHTLLWSYGFPRDTFGQGWPEEEQEEEETGPDGGVISLGGYTIEREANHGEHPKAPER